MSATPTHIPAIKTAKAMFTTGACSTAVFQAIDGAFGHPMDAEELASAPLAGGMGNHGYQCGQVWGAALAAGAQANRVHGAGARAETEALRTSVRIVEAFEQNFRHLNCSDLTEVVWKDRENSKKGMWKFLFKGGPALCAHMVVKYSRLATQEIDETLTGEHDAEPSPCASCAAKVARRMGASDQHVAMAAGLAGGIGLSGGGCGALGAAIWLTALDHPEENIGPDVGGTRVQALMEQFQAATDYEFECSAIVGRTFDGMEDHSQYVKGGGCAAIIEALVAPDDVESPKVA